ncbi:hypothetical protein [Streptomyces sp. NPDC048248]|uniref:hypothetical protein n=1 Tax=Streptomyces sp. NPDC048248 TaxID=3365523 RepID=UPI0037237C31
MSRASFKPRVGVGRGFFPWLNRPHYTLREIGARIAPLNAYLDLHDGPRLHEYNAGRRLTSNVVLEHGTEASAFGALNYRLGMTLAECARRSLMGLGDTWHIENTWPLGIQDPAAGTKPVEGQKNPRPELWGRHHSEGRHWMSEALSTCAELFQADRQIADRKPGRRAEDHTTDDEEEELEEAVDGRSPRPRASGGSQAPRPAPAPRGSSRPPATGPGRAA